MRRTVYVGQYAGGATCGVWTLSVDDETGRMACVDFAENLDDTLWLTLSADGTRLYAGRAGGVTVFDTTGRALRTVAAYETGGSQPPCHLSLSADGRRLYFAVYTDARCGIVDLESGQVRATTLAGHGPNAARQEKAHAHCAQETPNARSLAVADFGSDAIWTFDLLKLTPQGKFRMPPGSGPRHLVFHPWGAFAYVIFELSNTIGVYRFASDRFEPLQFVPLLPEGFVNPSQAAALKLSADGRQLFATNRGLDTAVAFDIDQTTGFLSQGVQSPLGGCWPRDLTLLPGGRIAIACLERTGEVRACAYEVTTRRFHVLEHHVALHRPVVAAVLG